jgi:hypothetical protein
MHPPMPARRRKKHQITVLLLLQLLLTFFVTFSILQDVAEDRPFVVSSKAALYELFFSENARVSNTKRNVAYLYDSDSLISSIENTVVKYFKLPETALNEMELLEDEGIEVRVRKMKSLAEENKEDFYFVDDYEETHRITSKTYASGAWKKKILGLDDDDDGTTNGVATTTSKKKKRAFLRSLLSLELKFSARSLHREMDKLVLFDFDVRINYNLESRGGRVQMEIFIGGNHVGGDSFKSVRTVFEDCFLLSLISFTQVAVVKSKFNEKKKTDGEKRMRLSRIVSHSLFNRSIALETLANAVLFVGCVASISWQVLPQEGFGLGRNFARGLNGFGCFLMWASLGRHTTTIPPYDVAFRAISRGLPVVLQFAVGSAPLLMGFTTLGVALFAEETEKFKNLENGFLTLFSVMNGDIIFESARDMKRGFIGHMYVITFFVIFVYTIISTFISIMGKAFAEIESEKRHEEKNDDDDEDDEHRQRDYYRKENENENENEMEERRSWTSEQRLRRELSAIKASLASMERSL